MLDRLRRVTDLFVEGTECFLGTDDTGKPVVVWVNKLNSFEMEEARQDGLVARGLALMQLAKPDNPERLSLANTVEGWSTEELVEALVEQRTEELYLDVLNELEADEEWAEKLSILRRMPALLADTKAAEDDPRRQELYQLQTDYLEAVRQGRERGRERAKNEVRAESREVLADRYFENWRNRRSLDDFMAERRVTELFFAIRDCAAVQRPGGDKVTWDHSACQHSRLLNDRSQVRELPEPVLDRVSRTLEDLTSTPRESGNSAAPQSSSESAEQRNEPEDSTRSTPEETSPVAPTT